MITRIKKHLQSSRRRAALLAEARELLRALDLPEATSKTGTLMEILFTVAVRNLQALKQSEDAANAAREMDLRIQQGPRPSYQAASQN